MGEKTKNKKNYKALVGVFWGVFTLVLISVFLLFGLLAKGKIGYIPPYEEIENPTDKFASRFYSADMKQLGKFYLEQNNRTYVPYDSLSAYLVKALICTEDVRFVKHSGVDPVGLSRAVIKSIFLNDKSGGSTITQQLAKQIFTETPSENIVMRIFQKLNEWVIAIQLERFYTKEEIIAMYFNQFDYLYNAIGIRTAAKVYFNTTPDKLKIEEAAMLVGMYKNPSRYNPKRFPKRALNRRNTVFGQMLKYDEITQQQFDSLKVLPLTLDFNREDFKQGPAPYFREFLRKVLTADKPIRKNYASWQGQMFYEDSIEWATNPVYGWCNKNFKPDGSPYNLYTDGLRIYTTIDSRMQKYAEDAVVKHLSEVLQPQFNEEKAGRKWAPFARNIGNTDEEREEAVDKIVRRSIRNTDRFRKLRKAGWKQEDIYPVFEKPVKMRIFTWKGERDTVLSPTDSILHMKHFLRAGTMAMDPVNGHVKTYVGGANYKYFMYDMVSLGKRQIGSTIKPFLYTLAMQEGFSPCHQVRNVPYTVFDDLGREWRPRNSGSSMVGELVTLKWALAKSNNNISSWLISQFKPQTLANLIKSMGVRSPIMPVPSLCLGTPDFSLRELASAYTTFANKGIFSSPVFVTRIEDSFGNVIGSFKSKHREVIDENTAYLMITMMQGVKDMGTANRLVWKYGMKNKVACKTGTTQKNSDGWFVGVLPRLVTASWVGGEERSIHFDSTTDGQGANTGLEIWALFMQKVYADESLGYSMEDDFEAPLNFNKTVDCNESIVPGNSSGANDGDAYNNQGLF